MRRLSELFGRTGSGPGWKIAAGLAVVVLIGWMVWGIRGRSSGAAPTFAARRGPLEITIVEGGSMQAQESQEIKCEVRVGYQGTKILKIVEEGYLVTEEDVKEGKVLVELDSSEIEKQIVQQEIQFQSALAAFIDAQQNYEIQLNQNMSDVQAAQQKVRFARMDFDKFLGDTVTEEVVGETGLDRLLTAAMTNHIEEGNFEELENPPSRGPAEPKAAPRRPEAPAAPVDAAAVPGKLVLHLTNGVGNGLATGPALLAPAGSGPGSPAPPPAPAGGVELPEPDPLTNQIVFDFSRYGQIEALGDGEAKQKLRKFEDDLQVAQKELGQASGTLEGTKRLFEKGFVTRTDLQRDEIAFENSRLKVQTAMTARDLFGKYDFLKSAEEFLSKYADAVREFDKARRVAISKMAQARAKLKSGEGQYQVQLRQRKDLKEQLEKCTIRARKPGLVVYGAGGDNEFFYGGEERIREGASVRERQAIITIPDLTSMVVKVKIHESYIKKVKKGQQAKITVDAFPDKALTGEVTKVGVLPDSQNRWMNPDMKVYLTTLTVAGTHDWLKPGMSAKVEVLVNKIADCVYVPVQAIAPEGEKQVCYVTSKFQQERREVETGEFNDEFIEVRSGLREGEQVLLRAPEVKEGPAGEREPEEEKPEEAAKPLASK